MWKTATLRKLLIKTETVNPTKDADKSFKYIDVSSVDRDTLSIREVQQLLGKEAPSRARRLVRQGDVIFATVRPTLKRIAIVPNEYDEQVCSTGYIVLRPDSQALHFKYLFYSMQSDKVMREIEAMQTGASYPAVTDTQVRGLDISYPPLPVQKQIVKKLDAAFADIDKAINATQKNIENAEALFQSSLNEIYENIENDKKHLKDICEYTKVQGKYKNLIYVGMEDMESRTGKFLGDLNPKEVKSNTFKFTKDHLLYGRLRPYLNKVMLPNFEGHCSTEIFPILVNENVTKEYLFYWFVREETVKKINKTSTGARMPRGNMKEVSDFSIRIPYRIGKQEEMVQKIRELEISINNLVSLNSNKVKELEDLKSSLLNQAFSGELIKDAA